LRAPVRRIRHALEVAARLHLVDDLERARGRDVEPRRELGERHRPLRERARDVSERAVQIVVAGGRELRAHLLDERRVREREQDPEIELLTHSAHGGVNVPSAVTAWPPTGSVTTASNASIDGLPRAKVTPAGTSSASPGCR